MSIAPQAGPPVSPPPDPPAQAAAPPPPAVQAFCDAFSGAADRAVDAPGAWSRRITVADLRVELRVAVHDAARTIAAPLEHLPSFDADQAPGRTVRAWDASSGVPAPPFPWSDRELYPGGAVHGLHDGRHRAHVHDDHLMLWDGERRTAWSWLGRPGSLDGWLSAAPLRAALRFATEAPGRIMVHAAAVGVPDAGILLGGPGHAGKSTTVAACLDAGLTMAGDDAVVLDVRDRPRAHSLYRTLKLGARSVPDADGHDGRRTRLAAPREVTTALPIAAVVVPRVAGGARSTLRPISGPAALRVIGPSTALHPPAGGAVALAALAALVRAVPCYALELGDDRGVPSIARLVEGLT